MTPTHSPTATGVHIELTTGILNGQAVSTQRRTIGDLRNVFADETARAAMPQDQLAYEVQLYQPIADGTAGGLFFGNTTIYPGTVGGEYIMTKGHFHALGDRTEYYLGVKGEGFLLFMDRDRGYRVEKMTAGSLHFIGPQLAHRVINTGTTPLTFLACWPADAGHDYATSQEQGFPVRVFERNGQPDIRTL
jgi:glucose-6-phosphate isomerase